MACDKIICPQCHKISNKTDQLIVMSELHSSGGRGIVFVSGETMSCPYCGRAIEISEIIEGKHDASKPLGRKAKIIIAIIVLILLVVLAHFWNN